MPIGVGLFVTIILSLIAYSWQYYRLYLIAVLFGIGFPLAELLYNYVGTPLDGLIVFGVPGIIIFLIGLVLFIRFLCKYTRPVKERGDDNR